MTYLTLNRENIEDNHICCAFSDKKCAASYQQKKRWLATQFEMGYVFRRLDERAKVFIECGLVTIVGTKKFHFMSDTKWLLGQGFSVCESISSGFSLISLDFHPSGVRPEFKDAAREGRCPDRDGLVAYYSNRCPYSEYHVTESLAATAEKRRLPLKVIKLETMEQARSCPSPATIFSLFLDGEFVTTDISVCMASRFNKIVGAVRSP